MKFLGPLKNASDADGGGTAVVMMATPGRHPEEAGGVGDAKKRVKKSSSRKKKEYDSKRDKLDLAVSGAVLFKTQKAHTPP